MTAKMPRIPSYRRHRASGQAVVTLSGVDHYLGKWNSPESRAEYDRITSEWLVRGRKPAGTLPGEGRSDDFLVKELVHGYWSHVKATLPDVEAVKVRLALAPVRRMYGEARAADFGPVAFKAVRAKLVEAKLSISTIRDRMGIIRRMVAWGVENERLPGDAVHRLRAVAPLRASRDGVKPARKVRPAPEEHIRAILPHLNPTVRAMVELQALTGMRPGEVWRMTTGQIDRSGDPWVYSPAKHKTEGRGKARDIPLGPRAQEALGPWLKADPDAVLFSPREAAERHYEATRRPDRPPGRSRKAGGPKKRKKSRARPQHETYNKNSYAQAITRGCGRAGIPVFTPNQVRHTYATRIRREYGLEAAQVLLGHSKADVTQVYAERDLALASKIAQEVG
jgi:integrase